MNLFLNASPHVYKKVCPSVDRSVGPFVGRSVCMSHFGKKCMKLRVLCTEMKAYKVIASLSSLTRGYAQKCLRTHRWPLGLVCMCVRICVVTVVACVCLCVCLFVNMCLCVCKHMRVRVCFCVHVCVHLFGCPPERCVLVCMHAYVCLRLRSYACVCLLKC